MTYVVTQSCIKCKYTDCVDVCPVDCFVEGPNFLAIDPEECIDCTLCVAECPVEAIYADDDVPEDQQEFIEINERLSKVWPIITSRKDPLPGSTPERSVAATRAWAFSTCCRKLLRLDLRIETRIFKSLKDRSLASSISAIVE